MVAFRYLVLRSNPSALLPQFPSYTFASRIQAALQHELLSWKAQPPVSRGPPPPPSVICFTPTPTYTLGRRQTEPLSDSELAWLRSPLFIPAATPGPGAGEQRSARDNHGGNRGDLDARRKTAFFLPTVTHAPRGGLMTYHGPGQLVIWPVIDLHSPLHAHLTVRDYACLLEKTTIATLKRLWGLAGFTTDNPGVWVRSNGPRRVDGEMESAGDERKIAALGVHLRRHVTGLGVAINYSTPVAGPAETNPWGRIVACGLGDRGVTSACAELGIQSISTDPINDVEKSLDMLAEAWQSEFQKHLKIHKDAGDAGFDVAQSMERLSAQVKGSDDVLISAQPASNLET